MMLILFSKKLAWEINAGRKRKTHWLMYAVYDEVIHEMHSYVIKMEIKQSWSVDLNG